MTRSATFRMMALSVFCGLFLAGMPAMAQTPADIDNANREGERIQREQLLRQEEERERALRSRRPPAKLEVPAPAAPKGQGEGCIEVYRIVITGGSHMPKEEKDAVTSPYLGRCLGVPEIQNILSEITRFYIENGYATTRAYLPEQDMSKGTLTIEIIEGVVGEIRLERADGKRMLVGMAIPQVEGEVLNLRDFEQALDQLNRLSSNNAVMNIEPGAKVGESIVVIQNQPSKRWHVNVTADNYGTSTTGRDQVSGTASFDNFIGLSELFSATHRRTLPWHDSRENSSSNSLLFSVPAGYLTATAGYSDSAYRSVLNTPGGLALALTGNSRSSFATLDYVALRTQDSKLNLSATLTNKRSNNYIADQKLDVSSRALTVFDLGAVYSFDALGGAASFGGVYSKGLKMLGALEDADGLPGSAPKAQFEKLTVTASYYRPFFLFNQDLSYSGSLTGQFGLDTLYGSEQISIGGIYSVRGFYEETLANDHGFYLRNDFSLRKVLGPVYGQSLVFKPYVAVDVGAVAGRVSKTPTGTIVGGAAGFSLNLGMAAFDVFAGHPLHTHRETTDEGFNTFARLSLTF